MLYNIMTVIIFGASYNAGTVKSDNNTNDIILCFDQLVMSKILKEICIVLEVGIALRHNIQLRRIPFLHFLLFLSHSCNFVLILFFLLDLVGIVILFLLYSAETE